MIYEILTVIIFILLLYPLFSGMSSYIVELTIRKPKLLPEYDPKTLQPGDVFMIYSEKAKRTVNFKVKALSLDGVHILLLLDGSAYIKDDFATFKNLAANNLGFVIIQRNIQIENTNKGQTYIQDYTV